jgi:hypothetical protein
LILLWGTLLLSRQRGQNQRDDASQRQESVEMRSISVFHSSFH